jgi:hypothetical protein
MAFFSTCPSTSSNGHQSQIQRQSVETNHSLSKYGLRGHVWDALSSKNTASPPHCVASLTRAALETVLVTGEAEKVPDSLPQSPALRSLRDSGYSEDGISTIEFSEALDAESSRQSSFTTPIPEIEDDVKVALATEAFKSVKVEQRQQFQRVSLFESNQRKALSSYHRWSLERLSSKRETGKAEKAKQVGLSTYHLTSTYLCSAAHYGTRTSR